MLGRSRHRGLAQQRPGKQTAKEEGWTEVSVASHSGKETSNAAEIARYTATDAYLGSLALKL